MIRKIASAYNIMWLVYILFLGVLMPHTAWTFAQFQEAKGTTNPQAWMLAFSVECVIAIFTHKLSEFIAINRKRKGFGKWVNGYSVGLFMVILISSFANLAYAVQFAGSLAVFAAWGIPAEVYEFLFGAMLPGVSLVFALVLSGMADDEQAEDPALIAANGQVVELRRTLRESEKARMLAEQNQKLAEQRLGTVTDMAKIFLLENKRERITAIQQTWPALPNSAIAVLSGSSPAYVSETLKESADVTAN